MNPSVNRFLIVKELVDTFKNIVKLDEGSSQQLRWAAELSEDNNYKVKVTVESR